MAAAPDSAADDDVGDIDFHVNQELLAQFDDDDDEEDDDFIDPGEPGVPGDPDEPEDIGEPDEGVLGEMEDPMVRDMEPFFRITPGVWTPWVSGEVSVEEQTADVRENPIDLIGDFGIGGMLAVEAGAGDFGLLVDSMIINIPSEDPTLTPEADEGEFEMLQVSTNAALAWTPRLEGIGEVGPLVGVRHNYINAEVETTVDDEVTTVEESTGWVDPIVGVTGRLQPEDFPVYVPFRADIGGIAFGSDLTWQAYGAIGVQPHELFGVELGYRHLYIDYENDELQYDMAISGPTLGITLDF